MSANSRGIIAMILFVSVLPILDSATKILTEDYHAPQILVIRFAFLLAVLLPPAFFVPANEMLIPANRGLLLLRGVLLAFASLFYVGALEHIPLATMTTIAMLYPLMVTAISPFALGEKVGVIRYTAVAVGFIGAVIVLRPTTDGLSYGEALGLGAPVCFTAYVVLTRRMSGRSAPIGQLLWTMMGGLPILAFAAVSVWQPITAYALGILILCGVLSLLVYMLQIAAFQGEASVVAPFSYLNIATAALAGYLIWGTLPDTVAIIGMGIIVASGVVVALRS